MHTRIEWDQMVVGLGESGHAAACHLADAGHRVAVMDTRVDPPRGAALRAQHPDVPVITGDLDERLLADADEIVLSPGVDPRHPALRAAQRRGQSIIGEIELFARAVNAPVIAITGSNGKTTVTRMVAAMAEQAGIDVAAGGNLGPAALSLLASQPRAELFVLELSSFQLETTVSLQPQVAAVLNLSPDHLDRYDDMAAYAAAKARIFRHAGHAVLNADDPWVRGMAGDAAAVHRFGDAAPPASAWRIGRHRGDAWLMAGETPVMPRDALALPGHHNALNALAALAIGEAAGLDRDVMVTALTAFRSLPHRTESLGWREGRQWVNDSKATNVGSAIAAIRGLEGPLVLIAGGDGKGQSFAALGAALAETGRAAVLFGRDAAALADALAGHVDVTTAADLDAALHAARRVSRRGDVILLSPACASLDQFTDYRARGDHFRRWVEALPHD
ncbi:UDP-N-acetylmuramoyl-L-alanine--D-glutamate ligase [Spiribacter roseus]|uniref:UDP-N-acetylmuramoyl-L-alanine--D-glutamate ligase n=1 Tax=Spiribacter roseus TaxID=1855875 RepID=UPI001F2788C1|nr:UDP-N-acetylmuramoyl-L-alanine--D-glutamate ligase [Spiribacter roseus]KAF0284671.1 UDP-N-acetylmuramoylalanine--D-glutamate ligase [Spiribacter roseus]